MQNLLQISVMQRNFNFFFFEKFDDDWQTMATVKPTTCKEAIRRWEEENGQEASSSKEIILSFQWPPIEKMDNALATLVNCKKLSLSTNMIEKIAGEYFRYFCIFIIEDIFLLPIDPIVISFLAWTFSCAFLFYRILQHFKHYWCCKELNNVTAECSVNCVII